MEKPYFYLHGNIQYCIFGLLINTKTNAMTKSTFIQNLIAERVTINAIELAQECIWAGYGVPAKRHLTRIGVKKVGTQQMDMRTEVIECPLYSI